MGIVAERVAGMRGEDILPLGYAGNMGMVARRFPRRMMHALGAGSHDHGICTAVGEAGHRLVLGDLVGPDLEEAATAELADVVLPACFFFEQTDLYRSYGHRYLHLARRAVEPPVGPKSNVRAFAAIARALGLPSITWEVTEESLVEDVLQASGDRIGEADLTRLKAGERVKLPPRRREGRGTPSGKVELYSEAEQRHGRPAMATWTPDPGDAQRPLWLCPVPSVATHNSTFFASERHKERAGPPSCWIHPDLARARGVQEGDLVRLQSDHGSLTLRARITSDVPADMVRVDGMPRPQDTPEAYGVNVLTGPETSDLGVGATFYSTRVELLPVV